MTIPNNLRKRGWRLWGTTIFRTAAIFCILVGMLNGKHPPAYAQGDAVANQHRDDLIDNLQSSQERNTAMVQKQWSEINDMKKTMQQMQIDSAAGTSTSNKVATGEIVALLASIGMQVRGKKSSKKSEEDD